MPFANNAALPKKVRDAIPASSGQRLFRNTVNGQLKAGKTESVAFASAWSALQNAGYKKNDKGVWVKEKSKTKPKDDVKKFVHGVIEALNKALSGEETQEDLQPISKSCKILKVDDEQRIVYGWASVCTKSGELVVDDQGDTIQPVVMEKMANDFMEDVRLAKAMHEGNGIGGVLHSLPLTTELAKALGIETDTEGWIIGMKVKDDKTWAKVKSGDYPAFSIAGPALAEEVDD